MKGERADERPGDRPRGGRWGGLVAYNNSLTQDDLRDIGSFQILATACAAVTVIGAALYLAAAVAGRGA